MRLNIKVTPNTKKTEITESGGLLKIKLTTPPIQGKANQELIKVLSKYFKVSKSKVIIITGDKSRNKIVEIKK